MPRAHTTTKKKNACPLYAIDVRKSDANLKTGEKKQRNQASSIERLVLQFSLRFASVPVEFDFNQLRFSEKLRQQKVIFVFARRRLVFRSMDLHFLRETNAN